MNFIELIFGFAPDNGSGFLELALIIVPAVAILYRMLPKRASMTLPFSTK